MLILTKHNLLSYLKDKYPQFDQRLPVEIHAIGEQEEDPAGLINFIFRVRSGNASIIVKQGQENIRSAQGFEYLLPPSRNHLEAISLRLRKGRPPGKGEKEFFPDNGNIFGQAIDKPCQGCYTGAISRNYSY